MTIIIGVIILVFVVYKWYGPFKLSPHVRSIITLLLSDPDGWKEQEDYKHISGLTIHRNARQTYVHHIYIGNAKVKTTKRERNLIQKTIEQRNNKKVVRMVEIRNHEIVKQLMEHKYDPLEDAEFFDVED